ncbi:proton-activated chloride channel isoform X2 [Pelodiscus sinensis]|uniref:proton-activated chloride channel isoform X2 n=1 Tax=Pelodiscus sinensis TaxID=13735 RepID=UPI003F6AF9A9
MCGQEPPASYQELSEEGEHLAEHPESVEEGEEEDDDQDTSSAILPVLDSESAVFLVYQTITDFREKLKHPVMSVSYKEVPLYDAPGIALYPGKAQLLSCKHHYYDHIPPLINPGHPGEIECTTQRINYTDPFTNQTMKHALIVQGPRDVKKKELVFLQFHLNETDQDFSAINYLLFSSFQEFLNSCRTTNMEPAKMLEWIAKTQRQHQQQQMQLIQQLVAQNQEQQRQLVRELAEQHQAQQDHWMQQYGPPCQESTGIVGSNEDDKNGVAQLLGPKPGEEIFCRSSGRTRYSREHGKKPPEAMSQKRETEGSNQVPDLSPDKAEFMKDCESSYSSWKFSGDFRTWVKMSLVKTKEEDGSETVEFKQETSVVNYIDQRHKPASDQLFFVVFEWKDPFIQKVQDIVTANPWNMIALLCGIFLALFKATDFAKLSVKWMIKIRKRHLKRRSQAMNHIS